MMRFQGSKGDSAPSAPAQHVPVEAADSLRSRAVARVLDLVSEGEIGGLVDGYKSVYLDGTPLQNDDGSLNFQGVSVSFTPGTITQQPFTGFPDSESETAVEVEVKKATPVTRTLTNAQANAVRVRIAVPSLYLVNSGNGDINGNEAKIAIDVQTAGGGFVEKVLATIKGKASSRYERDFRIDLSGTGPWDIRVRTLLADSTVSGDQRKVIFASFVTLVDAKLSYPLSAIVGTTFDSTQFARVPVRSFKLKGMIVRVPSNYNPVTRVYTGVWDGTFQMAHTSCPAWCWYDIVTADRYGMGKYIPAALVDKWTLYEIGKYCDALVPDGFGGYEPRFTMNLYLQTLEEGFQLIMHMASIFRAMVYAAGSQITCVQDSPADPVALFSPANIVGGYPSYSGSSIDQRHTVALVTWNDPSNHYRQAVEHVDDPEGIARYGIRPVSVVAFGCTSRGQAHRFGKWTLYSERLETDSVSWSAGADASFVRPGDIVSLHDPRRAGKRLGGRLVDAAIDTLYIDSPVEIEAGKTYTVAVVLPDLTVAERTVTSGVGPATTLFLSAVLPAIPQKHAVWVVTVSDLVPQLVRVLRVTEDGPGQIGITGLMHDPSKFAAIEDGLKLQPRQITSIDARPTKPSPITVTESLYVSQGIVRVMVAAVCANIRGARYLWSYKRDSGNFSDIVETASPEFNLTDALPGRYTFSVSTFSAFGTSQPAVLEQDVLGRGAPLSPVTNLTTVFVAGSAKLIWTPISDVRPFDYEIKKGSTVGSSVSLGFTPDPEFMTRGNGTYFVSARYEAPDGTNVYSSSWASVVVAGATLVENVIASYDEYSSSWTGTLSGGAIRSGADITLSGAGDLFASTDVIAIANFLFINGVTPSGEYAIPSGHRINAGREAYCNVSVNYLISGDSIEADVIGVADFLAITDFLGDGYGLYVRARPQVRVAPASGVYGAWADYVPGQVFGQYFDFKIIIESLGPAFLPKLSGFSFSVDVPDRVDRYTAQALASGGTTLTFSPAFNGGPGGASKPLIQGTILNATAGDDLKITADSNTGATFQVVNGGSGVARNVNITVEGY